MEEVIKYNRTIYSALAIYRAVEAFQTYFDVTVLEENLDSVAVQFRLKSEVHIRQLIGEFNNYLVQLENRSGLNL